MEIKMGRILKFNKEKANELIARMKEEVARIDHDLQNMVEVTANWFRLIRDKYAHEHPRRTEIRSFDNIEATKVIEATEKLYIDRENGFMGTSLKKDEFVENCSPIDDVIIFYRDGTYKVTRVQDKVFIGETERMKAEKKKKVEVVHIAVFKKGDKRTIYNAVYRDGATNACYIKRFNVTSVGQRLPGGSLHVGSADRRRRERPHHRHPRQQDSLLYGQPQWRGRNHQGDLQAQSQAQAHQHGP